MQRVGYRTAFDSAKFGVLPLENSLNLMNVFLQKFSQKKTCVLACLRDLRKINPSLIKEISIYAASKITFNFKSHCESWSS